ncbi:MAG: hypothetical protein JWN48_5976 [Myxococcaceae bacterium]|nr:hypothetical protein [Myxococcaceae bacterium]
MNIHRPRFALAFCTAGLSFLLASAGCSSDPSGNGEVDGSSESAQAGEVDAGAHGGLDAALGKPRADAALAPDATAPLDLTSDASPAPDSETQDAGSTSADAGDTTSPGDDAGKGKVCGGRSGGQCGAKQYCAFEVAALCGDADQTGTCKNRPEICNQAIVGTGFCGCDGQTYGNACFAEQAGTSVRHQGQCALPAVPPTDGKTCDGIAALACPSGSFCSYESAAGVGCGHDYPDQAGTCQSASTACQKDLPVCGCDHHSYRHACDAHAAGVSVLHLGSCSELDCKAIDGKVVYGAGPGPMCPKGSSSAGAVKPSSGAMPIEGAICCVTP